MTYTVEVVLRDTDVAVTESVEHQGHEPAAWTDEDVDRILRAMLRAIDHAKDPSGSAERPVSLRGLSWIVNPFDDGVVIALEIPSGAAVAGPFRIDQARLDSMVARVIAASSADIVSSAVH